MSINDEWVRYLRAEGYLGNVNDMLRTALQTITGSTSKHINTLWVDYLRGEGYTGSYSDMLYKWVGDKGYTGNINDRLYQALKADDVFGAADPISILGAKLAAWYTSDPSTLFTTSTGETPVTAAGEPVGLRFDKSLGMVLGPELVTNGAFDSDTIWTRGGGWSISAGKATFDPTGQSANSDLTQQLSVGLVNSGSGGLLEILNNGDYFSRIFATNGSTYEMRFTVSGMTPTGLSQLRIVVTESGGVYFRALNGRSFSGSVDNVSVRQIAGNHALQTTTTARPLYQVTPQRIVYDGVDDALTITLPAISGGQIVISSPVGIWIDSLDFAGGTFSLGPTTYTGGPARLWPDVISNSEMEVCILSTPMTTEQQNDLVNYLVKQGSAGLITLGAEQVRNPGGPFTDTANIQANSGVTLSIDAGRLKVAGIGPTAVAAGIDILPDSLGGNTPYLLKYTVETAVDTPASVDAIRIASSGTSNAGAYNVNFGAGAVSRKVVDKESGAGATGLNLLCFGDATSIFYVSSVSYREIIFP